MKNKSLFLMLLITSLKSSQEKILPDIEHIFTTVYENGDWWTGETYSGCGSNLYQTQKIREELPKIIKQYGITSLLDIPCGDFNWMKLLALNIPYIGADIVKSLVEDNKKLYENSQRIFMHLDLISDDLPKVDLVLCRDCLVHLSFANIWQALRNIKKSGAKYLLVTSYSSRMSNQDIPNGGWRPLNLMIAPFNFKNPLLVYNEGYEGDKCLVLWKLEDLSL